MFDIGFTEILLIGVISLVVLGPERLPVVARSIGLWVGKIKRTVNGIQREIQAELQLDEIRQYTEKNRQEFDQHLQQLNKNIIAKSGTAGSKGEAKSSSEDTNPPIPPTSQSKADTQ
jgi:sec-independent protein translocase protein TatB